jgi:tetratricopeptide (TPR) repeat protein
LPAALALLALAAALGGTTLRNRDYHDPVRLLEKTVTLAPHHARAHLALGTQLLAVGRSEEALAALHEGLRLDPSNAYGYLNLGKAYLARGEFERALPFVTRAAELSDDPRVADTLGGALHLTGAPGRAVPHFERALAANPDFAPTHCRYALALADLGRTREAEEHLRTALRLDARQSEAHFQLARLLEAEGRPDAALPHAEAAAELTPSIAEAQLLLARLQRDLGRARAALQACRRAVDLAPSLPEAHAELAQTVARLPDAREEERREALEHAQRASALAGAEQPELLLVLAEAEAGLGDHARALATLERALPFASPALAETVRARQVEYARAAGR